ncbi:MAG: 6-phosphofructokinase [Saprospiraceae bacterium]|nr:6-phosphofructokinase [Saprospiraceae bacterium]
MMANSVKRIAVFTSGGDAPGMNAAIRAVVRTCSFHDLHVYGIYHGYDGMIKGDIVRLEKGDVANIIHRGGTILKTARSKDFMTKKGRQSAYETLMAHDIDGVVAIGGNGTFTGAHIFQKEFGVPMVGVPGTIDNDLYGTDYTIGFDTAVNTAVEAVDKIRDTADSHSRLFFVEVMGRHSGFIALNTGIGSGAGGILIPESKSDVNALLEHLKKMAKRKKLFNLVVVAEGNENGSAHDIADIVKKEFTQYEPKVTIIGHLQRGGSPTALDRLIASEMGYHAVDFLMHHKSDIMTGIQNSKIVAVPLQDAIKKSKKPEKSMLKMANILSL